MSGAASRGDPGEMGRGVRSGWPSLSYSVLHLPGLTRCKQICNVQKHVVEEVWYVQQLICTFENLIKNEQIVLKSYLISTFES